MKTFRNWLLLLLAAGYFVNFLDRGGLAVAAPFLARDLRLDKVQLGLTMSAFFAGFVLLQIPAGILADRLGCRRLLIGGMAWWSAFVALTAAAGSFLVLTVVRFLFGAGEGLYPPSSLKAVSGCFPARRRAWANGVLLTGNYLALAVAPFAGALLIRAVGWRAMYLAFALPGAVVAFGLYRLYRVPVPPRTAARRGDWRRLAGVTPLWFLTGSWFWHFVAYWGLLTWLPTYLYLDRHVSILKMGWGAAVPYLGGIPGMLLGGWLADRLGPGRRRHTVVAASLAGAALLAAVYYTPGYLAAVGLLLLAVFCFSLTPSAVYAVPVDILPPRYAGTGLGLVNSLGMVSGVVAPTAVGLLVHATGGYAAAFWFLSLAMVLAAAFMALVREAPVRSLSVWEAFGGSVGWPRWRGARLGSLAGGPPLPARGDREGYAAGGAGWPRWQPQS